MKENPNAIEWIWDYAEGIYRRKEVWTADQKGLR